MRRQLGLLGCACVAAVSVTWLACAQAQDRYIASVDPVNVGLAQGICIAADPRSRDGIWWWEPGAAGCTTRSTGPDVFHAERARVTSTPPDRLALEFQLPTHSTTRPVLDVRIVVENGSMRSGESGPPVATFRRSDLNIPERPPRGGATGSAASASAPCVYRENGFRAGVNPPRQIFRVEPDLAGLVPPPPDHLFIVEVRIDETGRVTENCMLRGIGTDVDRRVLEALRAWRFDPPRLTSALDSQGGHWAAGAAVPIFMTVTVRVKPRS